VEVTLYNLIEDLEQYLKYQHDNGVERVEVDHEVFRSLNQIVPVVSAVSVEKKKKIPTSFSTYEEWQKQIVQCRNCSLGQGRVFPGMGCLDLPELVFVDESPDPEITKPTALLHGADGTLLLKMIDAMGLGLDRVFVTHVVKCAPKKDQMPKPSEWAACQPFLKEQIRLLRPKVVVAMGATALRSLMGTDLIFTQVRGSWQMMNGIRVMPTYRPSTLLRDPTKKKKVWSDLKQVLTVLGKEPPVRNK